MGYGLHVKLRNWAINRFIACLSATLPWLYQICMFNSSSYKDCTQWAFIDSDIKLRILCTH